MLVSGITEIGDPYGEEPVRRLLSHARATVIAETRHTFTASCPLELETVRETDTGTRRALYVLGRARAARPFRRAPIRRSPRTAARRSRCSAPSCPCGSKRCAPTAQEPVTVTLTEAPGAAAGV